MSLKFVPKGLIDNIVFISIDSGNGQALTRQQAITGSSVDPDP